MIEAGFQDLVTNSEDLSCCSAHQLCSALRRSADARQIAPAIPTPSDTVPSSSSPARTYPRVGCLLPTFPLRAIRRGGAHARRRAAAPPSPQGARHPGHPFVKALFSSWPKWPAPIRRPRRVHDDDLQQACPTIPVRPAPRSGDRQEVRRRTLPISPRWPGDQRRWLRSSASASPATTSIEQAAARLSIAVGAGRRWHLVHSQDRIAGDQPPRGNRQGHPPTSSMDGRSAAGPVQELKARGYIVKWCRPGRRPPGDRTDDEAKVAWSMAAPGYGRRQRHRRA